MMKLLDLSNRTHDFLEKTSSYNNGSINYIKNPQYGITCYGSSSWSGLNEAITDGDGWKDVGIKDPRLIGKSKLFNKALILNLW